MDTLKALPSEYYLNRAIGSKGFVQKLYKFYSIRKLNNNQCNGTVQYNDNLLNTIASNYLWHSHPSEFNDPFDCYDELIDYQPTPEAIRQISQNMGVSRCDRRREKRNLTKNSIKVIDAYKKTTVQQGICCFSANQKSNLMWSHYANNHTGLCLTFDHTQLLSNRFLIYRVIYENKFKALKYFGYEEDALFCKFTTKSLEWGYEEELRSINDRFGKIEFTKSGLIGVTFGCKCSIIDIDYVKEFINKSGYNNIEWSQAKMRKDSFDLNIDAL
jgi:hypothetical protein